MQTLSRAIPLFALSYAVLPGAPSSAQAEASDTPTHDAIYIEEILVIGDAEQAGRLPGSGMRLDLDTIDQFDYVDLSQAISSVPGVYVREEDGYGLRPNIGIRGAAAERSQKITLMEDGVLIAPAPYSAPAAYYMPNVSRMTSIEVLKGPAAIRHGPHTVGGAVNFVTRRVPTNTLAEVDLSVGNDSYYKAQGALGGTTESGFGALVEAQAFGAEGFKDLDGGGDTGFDRRDITAKLQWTPNTERDQQLSLKLGYADEDSNETYLGLTDDDFALDPTRRYSASQLGRFQSEHRLAHLNYGIQVTDSLRVNAKAYYNEFDREWNKLDGFIFGPGLQVVLDSPERFATEYALLTGAINSNGSEAQMLDVTNNDRSFTSTGIQASTVYEFATGALDHELNAGIRFHYDDVERDHRRAGFLMTDGVLVSDGLERGSKLTNAAETEALALYLSDAITIERWTVTLGARFEQIDGEFEDILRGTTSESSQSEVSPGIGVYWQASDIVGVLAGVNRGFSPAGPGSGADPERSVNYELGVRLGFDTARVELVGFFSDYSNILGRCRVSDTGCEAGEEFNGGEAEIAGLEVLTTATWPMGSLTGSFDLSYTYTESEFRTSFFSQFPQWGLVDAGDELPYLPRHMGKGILAVSGARWSLSAALKAQSKMREVPGSGPITDDVHTDDYFLLDLAGTYDLTQRLRLQLSVLNATDELRIVSRRPFGARPTRPRSVILRARYTFNG